jgi:geranylgeranyl diphosphate/geranylgeranyl-bacteriochlorophyllide a reductase
MTMTRSPPVEFEVIVVGGGPAGATAAREFALAGRSVLLVDRPGRIKPCGGAVPPCLLSEFDVPDRLLKERVRGARIISPSRHAVEMPIGDGFVGMVDRDEFDPWLRARACAAGAVQLAGRCERSERLADGRIAVQLRPSGASAVETLHCRLLIGADGANSTVRRDFFGQEARPHYVFAYHEVVASPSLADRAGEGHCDVVYDGSISPDFYGWVFPHGDTTSVGVGSAHKGFDLKGAVARLRGDAGLDRAETVRCEGAPLPLRPLQRWDDGRSVLLTGDAAGMVAPASGEGIYYAMLGGRLSAEAGEAFLATGQARALAGARARFMRAHGRVFLLLGLMENFWYRNDRRRERFVRICADADVQRLTWASYMQKRLVTDDPLAHLRVFLKDIGQLIRLAA